MFRPKGNICTNKDVGINMQLVKKQMQYIPIWPFYLFVLFFQENQVSSALTSVLAKPHCVERCGNLTIPYPFGIGRKCYFDKPFEIMCNDNKIAYLPWLNESVSHISMNYIKTLVNSVPVPYNRSSGQNVYGDKSGYGSNDDPYYSISPTKNKLVGIGCDMFAYAKDEDTRDIVSGCASFCSIRDDGTNGSYRTAATSSSSTHCTGRNGCCETAFSKAPKSFTATIQTMNTQQTSWASSNCSYILFVDKGFTNFTELLGKYSTSNCKEDYYFAAEWTLDWVIGNVSCVHAIKSPKYACGKHSQCINEFAREAGGYRCGCSPGYQGNPYLPNGCKDINECASPIGKRCPNNTQCINTSGSFFCETNSEKRMLRKQLYIGIVAASSSIILLAVCLGLYRRLQKRKERKTKQRFFKRNGGLLLEQRISLSGQSSNGNTLPGLKLFLKEELEKATDNFNERRILGRGGLGTVYKGMLADGSIVAVKKSNIVDETQVDQFINEIFILSQLSHRHIVKILGCCLETQVPLLVYEYISNGTLASHIHRNFSPSCSTTSTAIGLSWEHRLRVAAEAAGALSYLHSCASSAIFHRDIKSSNILLDENFRAVISDFGISRLVPIDKTHLTTLVGGTFGYLDPEYFRSGQLSDKSDVYAFGVVLAELLTSQKAVSLDTNNYDQGLVMRFKSSLKQGRILDIVDPEIVELVNEEIIIAVAKLAKRCLKFNSRERPYMKEVATVLDQLRSTRSDVTCGNSFQDNMSLRSESSSSYISDSQIEENSSPKVS
ncbi:wall-associated receptor kinase 2-like [Nicotiana tomentosiformis]|uniref:wall-associated receptor kinase 2-like n=1 Tax=Nicotiana tomentosiformis TaxID=4098 RepID=UPI00051AAFAD|nr:wall-associated receptor kinase 2-like [Nicotiana tomentosiformis]